jgi:hypothetical protein
MDCWTEAYARESRTRIRHATFITRSLDIEPFDRRPDGGLADRLRAEMLQLEARALELDAGAEEEAEEERESIRIRLDYLLGRWLFFGLHRAGLARATDH